ncbi:T9SS type A sorting domain-containing protein [Spirosoma taeanense]|uniref:T9SS type A sorting domain-containing protein n=2 Tax=Spirosoma taeanense TaxID=2735870 RepID=A0A6M5YDZ5_9BACT|nr:T9SS type A sorting domain-containing protein [Spirosoma taeanense]
MTITNTITPASCSGTGNGQIVVAVAGGTGNKQYQLNEQAFQTSNVFSNLRPGTYTVGVKDALGCVAQNSAEVKQPNSIALAFKAVSPKCVGGADGGLIVTATGGNGTYQYQLNGGTPQVSDTFFDLKSGSYTVTVTDRLGCAASQSVAIGAPNALDIRPVITPTRCVGSADGSVNVVAAGGAGSYQYQLGAGAFQTGTLFTGLAASTYEFTVKDANGCLGKQTATVPQPAPLNLTATSTPVNCFGANSGSITVTPSGGTGTMSYQLTISKTSQTSNVFRNIAIGDYTVVATDANGCTALAPVTVGKSEPLTVRAAPIPATCCVCPTGGAILATGGGTGTGRLFQLSGQPFQASNQFGGLKPGTYRFRVSDEAGCLDSVTTVITDASAMSLTAGRIKDIACAGGSDGEAAVQLTGGTKPFTFFWQTERKDTLRARTPTQTGLSEGTYTVSVVDSNRCTAATAFVTVRTLNPLPPKPVIAQVSNMLSVTEVTGIQWYVRGDTGVTRPIPNATFSTLTPVASGRYYVIVTQNGCASPPSDPVSFVLTALPEPGTTLSVRVVPNPVTDRLRLEMEQAGRQAVQVQLIDASGRSVFRQQIPPFTGQLQTEWPLAGIPPGLYLLKAEAGSRQAILRVLVQ